MKKQKSGFTLIELLVVIAIIGLLLSIITPSLNKAKASARKMICQSNLKQWAAMFNAFAYDNKNCFMKGWYGNSMDRDGQWMYALRDYSGYSHDIWCCPEADNEKKCPYDAQGNKVGDFSSKSPWGHIVSLQHTNYDTLQHDYGSYGINQFVYNVPKDRLSVPGTVYEDYWTKTTVTGASLSNIPVFMDDMWCESTPRATNTPPAEDGRWIDYGMSTVCINRHSDGYINMVFLDWSVRRISLKQLWYLTWSRNWQSPVQEPAWPDWMKKLPR